MTKFEAKILRLIYHSDDVNSFDIAPYFNQIFPSGQMERRARAFKIRDVYQVVTNMEKLEWLKQFIPNITTEEKNEFHAGYRWFNDIKWLLIITPLGRKAYEDYRFTRSQKRLNKTTRLSLKLSLVLTIISLALVALQLYNGKTDENLEAICNQLEKQNIVFDSINSNLKKLYKATEHNNLDTTRTKPH